MSASSSRGCPAAKTRLTHATSSCWKVPVIKAHSTRHTAAYLLHAAGVPAVRASAYLGHELRVHLSTYLFAREGDVDSAGVALGQVLANAKTGA